MYESPAVWHDGKARAELAEERRQARVVVLLLLVQLVTLDALPRVLQPEGGRAQQVELGALVLHHLPLAALLADNKVLLFHAAYILMLALIGNLATSSPTPHPPHYASITI